MVPGILSLTMILLPIILSLINPLIGAAFIIIYIISWLVKAIATSYRKIQGYNTLQRAQGINWAERLADLEDPAAAVKHRKYAKTWRSEVHERNLEQLAITEHAKKPSDIYNVIIIAAYNEGLDVIEPTINVVLESDYDMKRTFMVLTYEERDGAQSEQACLELTKKYGDKFFEMMAFKHPVTEGEVRGKGGNVSYAGRLVAKRIEELGIDSELVIVTTLDSDNRPHKGYFSYLTYEYIVHPEPRYTAFQPLTLYTNNIWDVPAPMRVVATGNTFFNIVLSLRPHLLRNFSAHSQGLASLIDMDFWSARTIVEDGHHFWRSYFRYDGHYDVVPIYVPIFQDAVLSDTYKRTLKAQFVQLRRWAYGASDVAYVATRIFRKDRTAPLFDSVIKLFRLLEGHVSWASASIILLLGAWAPLFLSPESSRSIVAHELPTVASMLQRLAMVGLFITVFLTFRLLPPRPERYTRRRTFGMLAQWLLMPVTSILYGSSAAINAQYRLLVGKYLDKFDVTEKAVIKDEKS
jgi:cellulose synthase/poly-beta-1,6-N-acetylglucosamine synthase-like glycosyltransferase